LPNSSLKSRLRVKRRILRKKVRLFPLLEIETGLQNLMRSLKLDDRTEELLAKMNNKKNAGGGGES
jgi:hypothetical protein